jgi:hypothetical protein
MRGLTNSTNSGIQSFQSATHVHSQMMAMRGTKRVACSPPPWRPPPPLPPNCCCVKPGCRIAGALLGCKPGGGGLGGGLGCQGIPRPLCCGGGLPGGGGAHCCVWNPGCWRAVDGCPSGGRGGPDQNDDGPGGRPPADCCQAGPGCCRVPAMAASLASFAMASRRCCCACRERSSAPTGSLPKGNASTLDNSDMPELRNMHLTTRELHQCMGRQVTASPRL